MTLKRDGCDGCIHFDKDYDYTMLGDRSCYSNKMTSIEIYEQELREKYEKETGEKAMYRMGSSDYHTLRYVNWLAKKIKGLMERFNSEDCPEWRYYCGTNVFRPLDSSGKCPSYGYQKEIKNESKN